MDLTIKNLELITKQETFSIIESLLDELIARKRACLSNVLLTEHVMNRLLAEINSLNEFRTFPGTRLREMKKQKETITYDR